MAKAKKPQTPKKLPKHIPPVRDYEAERKRKQRKSGTTPKRKRAPKAPVPDVAAMTAPVSGTSVAMSGTAPAPSAAVPDMPVPVPDTPPKVPDLPPPVRDVVPRPAPFRQAVAEWLGSWEGCGLVAVMTVGNWILEFGTWDYLLGTGTFYGVTYGQWAAGSVIAGELAVGGRLVKNWMAGRRDTWTRCMLAVLIGFMGIEAGVALLRETAAVHRDVAQATQTGASMRVAPCPVEVMPDTYITHPKSIDSWQAGANARHKACLDDQRAQRRESTGTLVANAKDRSQWEQPVLILAAVVLSAATSVCATALSEFWHSLLGVKPVVVQAPVRVPTAPAPARPLVAAPAARRNRLRDLAWWPFTPKVT